MYENINDCDIYVKENYTVTVGIIHMNAVLIHAVAFIVSWTIRSNIRHPYDDTRAQISFQGHLNNINPKRGH